MTAHPAQRPETLLLYEPRTEGHHLGWLRFITEDLLSANFQLSLAVDLRANAKTLLHDHLAGLLNEVRLISAYDEYGRRHCDRKAGSVAFCLEQSGAENVFLCALDEIASDCWRRAAIGIFPPTALRGHLGGIYHRPRFLAAPSWSPMRLVKEAGFRRLLRGNWLRQLLFVDEELAGELHAKFSDAPIYAIPDPCPSGYDGNAGTARQQLGVPLGKRIFLFYGTGGRRKGLHLAVEAMLGLPVDNPAFLLCVGQQNPAGEIARGLDELAQRGQARVINRYVSTAEEKAAFAASDVVLLPYLNHYGTSGVLSRAMSAGKMVIVSDEQLLGQLTRQHGLGLLFPSGDAGRLRDCLLQASALTDELQANYVHAASAYAQKHSRVAYRNTLLASLNPPRSRAHVGLDAHRHERISQSGMDKEHL